MLFNAFKTVLLNFEYATGIGLACGLGHSAALTVHQRKFDVFAQAKYRHKVDKANLSEL